MSDELKESIRTLQTRIKLRLEEASHRIVQEEVSEILGRVRVYVQSDLKNPTEFSWYIQPGNEK